MNPTIYEKMEDNDDYENLEYNIGKKLGEGTYGNVFSLGENIAGKIFRDDTTGYIDYTTVREISSLSYFNHPNIVKIINKKIIDDKVILIMEKANNNLSSIMSNINNTTRPYIIYQILNALSFIHRYDTAHRDIKPSNILLFDDMNIKICDFGLSKVGTLSNITHTPDVITRGYKAPEVILNPGKYDVLVDVWSVGIILFDMIYKTQYQNYYISDILQIFNLIGTPDEKKWEGVSKMEYWDDKFPKFKGNINDLLSRTDASDDEKDLLKKMLNYPPNRISSIDALNHNYFNEIKQKHMYLNTYSYKTVYVNIIPCILLKPIEYKKILYEQIIILFSWLFDVKEEYNFNNSTFFTALNIFNEYIKYNNIEKKYIQLVGIICLYISSKLLDVIQLVSENIIYLCCNFYTKIEVEKMILEILFFFNFNIIPMIIKYKNEKLNILKKDNFFKILSFSITNDIILKKLSFFKIINASLSIIDKEVSIDTLFILTCISKFNSFLDNEISSCFNK